MYAAAEKPVSNMDLHPSGALWNAKYAGYLGLRTLIELFNRTPLHEMSRFHGAAIVTMEGFMRPPQYKWLKDLFAVTPIAHVGEIGFNGGHSAFAFAHLGAASITSFDLGEHSYALDAASYLQGRFPGTQFELVLGDSRVTVPGHESNSGFDLSFIDGAHSLEAATNDIMNMRRLSQPNGLVIVDDYTDKYPWRTGPKIAYDQAVNEDIIEHLEVASGHQQVWALGRYTS